MLDQLKRWLKVATTATLTSLNVHFSIIIGIASSYGVICVFLGGISLKTVLAMSLSLCIATLCFIQIFQRTERTTFYISCLYCIGFALTIPTFFFTNAVVVTNLGGTPKDEILLYLDDRFLGWLFPQGQLALWLDQSTYFNPSTFIGKLYTEFFELVYVSYYFWGYLFELILLVRYCREWFQSGRNLILRSVELKMYLCGWLFSYYFAYVLNVIIPAKSPRLYLEHEYQYSFTGFGLAPLLMSISTDNSSYGSFPSGHVLQTFVAALYGWRLVPWCGKVAIFFAGNMALATLFLRYHYFTDLIGSAVVLVFSLVFGFYLPKRSFEKLRDEAKQEDARRNVGTFVDEETTWDDGSVPLAPTSQDEPNGIVN